MVALCATLELPLSHRKSIFCDFYKCPVTAVKRKTSFGFCFELRHSHKSGGGGGWLVTANVLGIPRSVSKLQHHNEYSISEGKFS